MPDNSEQVNKFLSLFNADKLLSKDDVNQVVSAVTKLILTNKAVIDNEAKQLRELVEETVERVFQEHEAAFERINQSNDDFRRQTNQEVQARLGLTVEDVKKIAKEILAKVPKDGYTPVKGVDYFDGPPGQPGKDGSPDTPEQIVEKLKSLNKAWVALTEIDGFEDYMRGFGSDFLQQAKAFVPRALQSLYDVQIKSEPTNGQTLTWDSTLKKWIPGTAASGNAGLTLLSATGTVNGTNADFTFTSKPTYIVADGAWYVENTGWTWSGNTATMTVPPQAAIWGFS